MLEEKLELLIITYNRAAYLERTLAQLLASPFAGCRLTVLDNCSTDETAQVCAQYRDKFAQMRVVRHQKNIGACANYLRAVELSSSAYTWVLCDDDLFDFSDCADVIAAVEAKQYDLISLGSPGQFAWERGLATTSNELMRRGARYFGVFTFLTGVIFRTKLYDSECVAKGYQNIANSFPHFPFIKKGADNDFTIYVSKQQIVHRDHHESMPSGLYFHVVWVNSCRLIEDRKLRRKVLYQSADTRWEWFRGLFLSIAVEKKHRPDKLWGEVLDLAKAYSADQKFLLFLTLPAMIFPISGYKLVGQTLRALRGQPRVKIEESPFDPFRL